MDDHVAREIIFSFYETDMNFGVRSPRFIASFLQADFFKSGITPGNAILGSINVHASFDEDDPDALDLQRIKEHFAPLIAPAQKWAKEFRLTISFRTVGCLKWAPNIDEEELAGKLSTALRELKPFMEEAHGPKRRAAVVTVKLHFGDGRKLVFTNEDFEKSKEQWIKRFKALAG